MTTKKAKGGHNIKVNDLEKRVLAASLRDSLNIVNREIEKLRPTCRDHVLLAYNFATLETKRDLIADMLDSLDD